MTRSFLTVSLLLISMVHSYAQEVPHNISNRGVYEFLDELASLHVITVNSAVKPYSRMYIAQKLNEADGKREQLDSRKQYELDFYLKDFRKELTTGKFPGRRRDLFYYSDSLFQLTVNPILGGEMIFNQSGRATYWRNGAEARGYAGSWGFYASLRDNHEKPLLGRPTYLTKREGGHIKGSTDWSEMQGGVTYSWKWGSAGLIKDRQQWGTNYNGANIFAGNNPSFVQLRLEIRPVKWFVFNYFHGWLNSMEVDSSESYWVNNSYGPDFREVYHKKFIAANMFTFMPLKNLYFSAGNSIIYSADNVNPAYLIPVLFYKSVDHSQTSGIDNMNSQMYFDISSRQIRHLHIYGTLFVDELSVARFTKNDEWNFLSWKAGMKLTDLPLRNVSVTGEFTYTYPLTFMHYVPTLTFETTRFNLGHYLRDNSREWFFSITYKPLRTLKTNIFFSDAVRGPDYTALGTNRVGNPPLAWKEWHSTSYGFEATYQVINDVYVGISVSRSDVRGNSSWSSPYFYGPKNNISVSLTAGF